MLTCCSYINYYEQYLEYDAFMTLPEPSNPWISDNIEFWEQELTTSVSASLCYLLCYLLTFSFSDSVSE